jgi:hypothetical protein
MTTLPEHVSVNRAYWDSMAADWVERGRRHWAATEMSWDSWAVPQADLPFVPRRRRGP